MLWLIRDPDCHATQVETPDAPSYGVSRHQRPLRHGRDTNGRVNPVVEKRFSAIEHARERLCNLQVAEVEAAQQDVVGTFPLLKYLRNALCVSSCPATMNTPGGDLGESM